MGVSRDTFYRYQHAHEEGGVEALIQTSRCKPNPKNRVDEAIEAAVIAYALEQPAHGQLSTSNELRQRGIFVSPSGVRSIWMRHQLASFKQRLSNLEAEVAKTGAAATGEARERKAEALAAVQRVSSVLGEISTAAEEQQTGISQVNAAVAHMDSITQENAAMVEALAAAAQSLRGQVHSVSNSMRLFRLARGEVPLSQANVVELEQINRLR